MVRNADLRRRRNRAGEDMPLARETTRAGTRILLILLTATESVTSNFVILTVSIHNKAVICTSFEENKALPTTPNYA